MHKFSRHLLQAESSKQIFTIVNERNATQAVTGDPGHSSEYYAKCCFKKADPFELNALLMGLKKKSVVNFRRQSDGTKAWFPDKQAELTKDIRTKLSRSSEKPSPHSMEYSFAPAVQATVAPPAHSTEQPASQAIVRPPFRVPRRIVGNPRDFYMKKFRSIYNALKLAQERDSSPTEVSSK